MKIFGYTFIIIGLAVLVVGMIELSITIELKNTIEKFSPPNLEDSLHMPGDREIVALSERLSNIRLFRVVESFAVSFLCFLSAKTHFKRVQND